MELEAETEGMRLVSPIDSRLASVLIEARTTCLGNGVTDSGLGSPLSVNNQDPPYMSTGQSDLGSLPIKILLR